MRIVKYLTWFVVIAFTVISAAMLALLMTSSGSRLVLEQVAELADVELQFEHIEGNLVGELILTNVTIRQYDWNATLSSLTIAWSPSRLLDGELVFDAIQTQQLHLTLVPKPESASDTAAIVLPTVELPLTLVIHALNAQQSRITVNQQTHELPDVMLRLGWDQSTVSIDQLYVDYPPLQATLSGHINTSGEYPIALMLDWVLTQPTQQVPIRQVSGNSQLEGTVDHFYLRNQFYVESSREQHQVDIEVRNLLAGEPEWLAQLQLTEFSVAPLLPVLNVEQTAWYDWLHAATITLDAQIDTQQAVLTNLAVNRLGHQQGNLQIHGVLNNYLAITDAPETVVFKGNLTGANIEIPETVADQPISINELNAQLDGSITHYHHDLTADVEWFEHQTLHVQLNGIGNQHQVTNSIQVESEVFSSNLTAMINWQTDLQIQADIAHLQADLSKLTTQLQVQQFNAHGQLGFQHNRLTASELVFTIDDNQILLDGAMTQTKPLLIAFDFPELAKLHQHDYVAGRASASLSVVGDIFKELSIDITQFELDHPDFGTWSNGKTGTITVPITHPVASSARDLCIIQQGIRTPAEFCIATTATRQQQHTHIAGKNLPLALLNRFRDATVAERVWGLATLTTSFIYNTSTWEIEKIEGELRSERTILFALDEEISTRFDYWQLNWSGNLQQIKGSITAELEQNKGMIIGDIAIEPFKDDGILDGEILMNLRDLTVLQWVLPDLRYEDAHALAEINISGTNRNPVIEGSVELAAREIGFAQSGLLLTNVRIAAYDTPDVEDSITLDGQALSGDGWISIDGLIEPLKPELLISIEGENFRAIQVPTVVVDISPKLTIKLKDERIDIQGELTVPYAKIDQPEIAETGTSASNDVVVLKDGTPVREQQGLSHYPVYADVRVTLGDNINVSGYGFEGALQGSLRLIETPTRALTASGSVSVRNGHYKVYGQRLEIERGSLIYNGGPIDNPGLDLRVERASENILSTEDVRVGAQVSGTLHEPNFRLYSTPTMPDSEILSYLILGRGSGTQFGSSDNLQLQALILLGSKGTDYLGESLQSTFGFDEFGIDSTMNPNDTSFYIGKYLSPKLYVKYGVGLFEDTNTFLIRYLLADKLIIESTTSSEAQGGDIFYTIEK